MKRATHVGPNRIHVARLCIIYANTVVMYVIEITAGTWDRKFRGPLKTKTPTIIVIDKLGAQLHTC